MLYEDFWIFLRIVCSFFDIYLEIIVILCCGFFDCTSWITNLCKILKSIKSSFDLRDDFVYFSQNVRAIWDKKAMIILLCKSVFAKIQKHL